MRHAWLMCGLVMVLGAAPMARAAELKIGYVNLAKLFDDYQRTKDSERTLTQKGEQKEAQLKGQAGELKKMRDSLELLNAQARETKVKELEEKSDALQQLKTRAERDLVRERNQAAKTILDEIERVVTEYAKANNFTLLIDQRSLLYGQDGYDVTDTLLKLLNDRYAGQGTAKAPAPAAKKP
jgi:outer membrane protein